MIPQSRVRSLTVPALALAGVLALCITGSRAKADQWDKKTVLTIDQPIQVRNTYLQPGTYVFKLLDSPSDRHIVQIFNSDQSRIIDTVLAVPNYRLQPTGKSRFAFWETPPGTAKALRAWFYPGDNFGQEFPYPKHLRQLEVASVVTHRKSEPANMAAITTPEPETTVETPAPAEQPVATAAPTTEPAYEPTPDPTTKSEEPVVIAQATPAPAELEQTPEPQQQTTPRATELPRTASPYPAFGLFGFLSLFAYAAFRIKSMS